MRSRSIIKDMPIRDHVAAISCGVARGTPVLDLDYAEDSSAEVDANFVIAGDGRLIEIQATGEQRPFSEEEFAALLGLAKSGARQLFADQLAALG
jgi:ribonuclease PH